MKRDFSKNPLWKNLIMILACIIVMAFLAHVIAGGESLSDYAEKHPEAAYGTGILVYF